MLKQKIRPLRQLGAFADHIRISRRSIVNLRGLDARLAGVKLSISAMVRSIRLSLVLPGSGSHSLGSLFWRRYTS